MSSLNFLIRLCFGVLSNETHRTYTSLGTHNEKNINIQYTQASIFSLYCYLMSTFPNSFHESQSALPWRAELWQILNQSDGKKCESERAIVATCTGRMECSSAGCQTSYHNNDHSLSLDRQMHGSYDEVLLAGPTQNCRVVTSVQGCRLEEPSKNMLKICTVHRKAGERQGYKNDEHCACICSAKDSLYLPHGNMEDFCGIGSQHLGLRLVLTKYDIDEIKAVFPFNFGFSGMMTGVLERTRC
ncbi:hypothetical protein WAI453_013493 [Rhynchosporium graminicola]